VAVGVVVTLLAAAAQVVCALARLCRLRQAASTPLLLAAAVQAAQQLEVEPMAAHLVAILSSAPLLAQAVAVVQERKPQRKRAALAVAGQGQAFPVQFPEQREILRAYRRLKAIMVEAQPLALQITAQVVAGVHQR